MKTVLFDLDGTLLEVDINHFLKEYLQAISGYCTTLAQPMVFVTKLLESTELMIRNNGVKTNEEVFMESFLPALGKERGEVYPLLESFYEREFPLLQKCVRQSGKAAQVVEEVLRRGWQIILATNPLFPRQAILERMKWAGVLSYPWLHITSYENCRSCKPNLLYYQEIISRHGLNPEECWMIGNDTGEDLVASQLGLKTYLVTDFVIERQNSSFTPKARGTMEELLAYIKQEF